MAKKSPPSKFPLVPKVLTKDSSVPPPPVVFFFEVQIGSESYSFQEVSGLDIDRSEIEEISEGGVNTHKHRLPKGAKYTNLVLKRGLADAGSSLFSWVQKELHSDFTNPVSMKPITISLLNPSEGGKEPLLTWSIVDAWPVKWSVSGFNSMENAYVIENLEFSFKSLTVEY